MSAPAATWLLLVLVGYLLGGTPLEALIGGTLCTAIVGVTAQILKGGS